MMTQSNGHDKAGMSKCVTRPEIGLVVEEWFAKQERLDTWLRVKPARFFYEKEKWNLDVLTGKSDLVDPERATRTLVDVKTPRQPFWLTSSILLLQFGRLGLVSEVLEQAILSCQRLCEAVTEWPCVLLMSEALRLMEEEAEVWKGCWWDFHVVLEENKIDEWRIQMRRKRRSAMESRISPGEDFRVWRHTDCSCGTRGDRVPRGDDRCSFGGAECWHARGDRDS